MRKVKEKIERTWIPPSGCIYTHSGCNERMSSILARSPAVRKPCEAVVVGQAPQALLWNVFAFVSVVYRYYSHRSILP
jgi:hypothetical protein